MKRSFQIVVFVMLTFILVACNGGSNDHENSEVVTEESTRQNLEVHFIDVDQGDATLLLGPDFSILVDAGRHDRDEVVPYLQSVGVTSLDLLVGTHPHADHIGQMDQVIERFDVEEIWMSGDLHTSQTFEHVLDAALASEANYHEPRAGETHTFGAATIEVIHPEELIDDLNEGSVSMRIQFGDVRFLFTGDVEEWGEADILARGHDVGAEIFQLGHHGSSTSNTSEFLEAVDPEIAIYSAGEDNSYGHPHTEVVERIRTMNIELYGTDVHGTIIVETDGVDYEVVTEYTGTIDESEPEVVEEVEETAQALCIDINSASKEELADIIHIDEARSDQLIELRPHHTINGLKRINGIGDGRLAEIKEQGLACVKEGA
ncbi:MBL fold metallo-hydrolase [Desertibacillus haloalkaliphilus]|uniref:MBL fold metallo-hydrolase n=1 Tax=Desertibacillus haloalkaliphilus TaxID=1328930 RepID=UPI001C27C0D2|nr:MBL fold metallo-hydrolase [Desertibacillus haloalkaliphilus]MBU8905002.1 MBL fold metallo-hydrolase [Desertibacillus haloalkaliphilus]